MARQIEHEPVRCSIRKNILCQLYSLLHCSIICFCKISQRELINVKTQRMSERGREKKKEIKTDVISCEKHQTKCGYLHPSCQVSVKYLNLIWTYADWH